MDLPGQHITGEGGTAIERLHSGRITYADFVREVSQPVSVAVRQARRAMGTASTEAPPGPRVGLGSSRRRRTVVFDTTLFLSVLDAERESRGASWRRVAVEAGVSPSTLSRLNQGRNPDVDGLAALAAWANLDIRDFSGTRYRSDERGRSPLAAVMAAVRADPHLTPEHAAALEAIIRVAYKRLKARGIA